CSHALALVEGLALAHQRQGALSHGCQVAASADTSLFAHDGSDARVEHGDVGERNLWPTAREALGVNVDAAEHGRAHVLDGRGLANARSVVVDEVFLEFLYLL